MRARGRPDRGGGRAPAAAGAVVSASASAPGGRKQHPAVAEASARASPSPLRPITNTSDEGGRGGRRRRGKTNDVRGREKRWVEGEGDSFEAKTA